MTGAFRERTAIVCRCEALTKADVNAAIALGVRPKPAEELLSRWDGPLSGTHVRTDNSENDPNHNGGSEEEIGYLKVRPPIRPLTVGELAALAHEDAGR